MPHDIETEDDIVRLVDLFYERAFADPLIGYLFTDVAKLDMEKHRPTITAFWSTLLLGSGSYGGGAFAVHRRLDDKSPLQPGHFDRWVVLWTQTTRELFAGPVAEAAVGHGHRIASAFQRRLAAPAEFDGTMLPLELVVTRHGGPQG